MLFRVNEKAHSALECGARAFAGGCEFAHFRLAVSSIEYGDLVAAFPCDFAVGECGLGKCLDFTCQFDIGHLVCGLAFVRILRSHRCCRLQRRRAGTEGWSNVAIGSGEWKRQKALYHPSHDDCQTGCCFGTFRR